MSKNCKTPFLFIETPRAGKWNHRHIVPPGVPQKSYLDIIEIARQKTEGDNFLAVGHDNKVKQIKDNRYAPELLVLAGIDTKRLSDQQRKALQDSLNSLLRSVDTLVTGDIDWNREGENDPVVREELAVWFNQQFKDVETIVWNQKSKRLYKKIMSEITIVLLVLLGLGGGGYYSYKQSQHPPEDPHVVVNERIQLLSNEGSPREEALEELKKAGLIVEKSKDKFEIPSDIDLNIIPAERVFPQEISVLFSNNADSVNLNTRDTVKKLISCKEEIITFAELSNTNTSHTPFITPNQVEALKNKIKGYRKQADKDTYEKIIKANRTLESSCGKNLADTSPLEFLIKCDKAWGREDRQDPFWKNAESLLKSCGKVKL